MCISLEDLTTQLTIVGILQERHHARVVQGEDPLALQALLFRGLGRLYLHVIRQAGKIRLIVNHQLIRIGLFQYVLAEGQLQRRDLRVQLTQLRLICLRQVSTTSGKPFVGLFQQLHLLLVEP